MRYSLLAGGKRIRPVLALATARAIGLEPERAARRGCDRADPHLLADPRRPAGDGRRRAAPRACRPRTSSYGENVAILAGDGLFAEAIRLFCERQDGRAGRGSSPRSRELVAATGVGGHGRRPVRRRHGHRARARTPTAPARAAHAQDRATDRSERRRRPGTRRTWTKLRQFPIAASPTSSESCSRSSTTSST